MYAVKEAVFLNKFPNKTTYSEMKSTGEVMGFDKNLAWHLQSQIAAANSLPKTALHLYL